MIASRRTVLAAAVGTLLLSGGTAWAAAGLPTGPHPHLQAPDVTSTTDTTVDATSTTSTTDTTDTTVGDTSTTSTVESTTTVPETSTTVEATPTTQQCKPGWGYGDKNHCHSGPPGLMQHHGHGNH